MSLQQMMMALAGAATVSVSPVANGQSNSLLSTPCYAGVQFNSNGIEYEASAASGTWIFSQGNWLDTGTAGQVWIERVVTSGSWNNLDPGTGRHQLSTSRSFRVYRVATGSQSVTGYFRFWDAASGGNNLYTTSSATYSAENDFDPCPLCCFTPLTPITMADGTTMPIVDVIVGDLIRVQGGIEPVTEIITRRNRVMHLIMFADGRVLEASEDHPLYVDGKGYTAVNPDPTIDYKDLGVAETLALGDKALDQDGRLNIVVSITKIDYPDTVYTFENSRFYANGMLVY